MVMPVQKEFFDEPHTGDEPDQPPNNQAHTLGIWVRMKPEFRKAIQYIGVLSLIALLLLTILTTGLFLAEGPDGVGERVGDITGNEELGDRLAAWLESNRDDPNGATDDDKYDSIHPHGPEEEAIETAVLDEVNEVRDEHDLNELRSNADLAAVSRQHSHDMITRTYFAHESPDGHTPADRIRNAGIQCRLSGENLAMIPTGERVRTNGDTVRTDTNAAVAEVTVNGWVESPGHFEVMTTAEFASAGVGVVIDDDGNAFVTMKFCG